LGRSRVWVVSSAGARYALGSFNRGVRASWACAALGAFVQGAVQARSAIDAFLDLSRASQCPRAGWASLTVELPEKPVWTEEYWIAVQVHHTETVAHCSGTFASRRRISVPEPSVFVP